MPLINPHQIGSNSVAPRPGSNKMTHPAIAERLPYLIHTFLDTPQGHNLLQQHKQKYPQLVENIENTLKIHNNVMKKINPKGEPLFGFKNKPNLPKVSNKAIESEPTINPKTNF